MAEALAIFGLVGTAVGIVGFLAQTAENLATRRAIFVQHRDSIKRYHVIFRNLYERLHDWRRIWHLEDSSFGSGGFQERWGEGRIWIEEQLRLIHKEVTRIQQQLYGVKTLTNAEGKRWLDFLHVRPLEPQTPVESSLFERMLFALSKDHEFNNRLGCFRQLIEALEQTAGRRWLDSQGLPPDTKVDSLHVKESLDLQQKAKNLCGALTSTHRKLVSEAGSWALVLRPPTALSACPLMNEEVTIELLQTVDSCGEVVHHRLTGTYEFDERENDEAFGNRILRPAQETELMQCNAELQDDMRGLFSTIVNQPNNEIKAELRTGTLYDRARAALCIASWTVSAWSSEWMKNLCNCGVRQVKFPSEKVPTLAHRHNDEPDNCFDNTIYERRHLLLGLVLAELALAQPIHLSILRKELTFLLIDTEFEQGDVEVTQSALLRKILQVTGSRQYRDAVKSCFLWDESRLVFGTDVSQSPIRNFQAEDVKRYATAVIPKLETHYRNVAGRRSRYLATFQRAEQHPSITCY